MLLPSPRPGWENAVLGPPLPIQPWVDPRGRAVRLYAADWDDHVVYFHPVMRRRQAWVQAAIEHPDAIYRDAIHWDRECYYRGGLLVRRPALFVKVVVEYSSGTSGRVVTAYPTDSFKSGEVQLWP